MDKNKTNEFVIKEDRDENLNGDIGYILYKYKNVGMIFSNPMGKVHGGAMATWVDLITS